MIEACVDRLWLVGDGRVKPFDGDLDDYRRILLGHTPKPDRASASDIAARSRTEERRASAEKRAALAPLKKRADQAEREYTRVSAQIGDLEVKLADPALYAASASTKANDLMKKRGELRRQLEKIESDWLEAQHAYEAATRASETAD